MLRKFLLLWFLATTSDFVLAQSSPGDLPTIDIQLKTGTFRGVNASFNGTEQWLGIPFAQPPVGALRFKAPVAIIERAEGIQSALTFGNACPQLSSNSLGAPVGEDCLVLNVCTSSHAARIQH